jgi:hypothetical protein
MSNKVGRAISDDDEDIEVEGDEDTVVEDDDEDDFTDTVILSDTSPDDDDEESTAEINVEKLMAELEKTDHQDAARRKEIRRRLEELAEERSFEDTYAFDFDEE